MSVIPGLISSQAYRRQIPAAAVAADNGLSIDPISGNVVLGNDADDPLTPAILLSDREIVMDGFALAFKDAVTPGTDSEFRVEPSSLLIRGVLNTPSVSLSVPGRNWGLSADPASGWLNLAESIPGAMARFNALAPWVMLGDVDDTNTGIKMWLNQGARVVGIGDLNGIFNGTQIEVDDPNQEFVVNSNANAGLSVGMGAGLYAMGALSGLGNGTKMRIDDATQVFTVLTGLIDRMLSLDQANAFFELGDLNNINTGLKLQMDAIGSDFGISNATGQFLNLLVSSGVYQMGDIIGVGNGLNLSIDDTAQTASLNNSVEDGLLLDFNSLQFQLGAPILGNGTRILINDASNQVNIANNALTASIEINGVSGFTGTVSPVTSITVDGGIVTAVS